MSDKLTTIEKAVILGALKLDIEQQTEDMMPGTELYAVRTIDFRKELMEKVRRL